MKPTVSTRKPVDGLLPDDLATFPVWEFATDEEGEPGRDETWVRPVRQMTIPIGRFALGVGATFISSQGLSFDGVIWIDTINGLEVGGAALFVDGAYLPLEMFGPNGRSHFPLRFRLTVPVSGECELRSGVFD